ncbi:aldehyde dehydrogenase domain-containing protein [Hyaloraphidium curvatum]|nr:aldehyde dehydrogenase domain-containing protein [Hyaloraphidium curvatum]
MPFQDVQEIQLGPTKAKIHTGLFINNEFVASQSGKTFPSINPATGDVIVEVQEADKADVDIAVRAAQAAAEGWQKVPGAERGKLLWKLADLVERDREFLATLEALDNGKKVHVAKAGDLGGIIATLRYYAGWADKIHGKVMMDEPNFFNYTRHEPYGVCGAIIPWNFPALMLAWKLAPALATGNCLVLKSSEKTPLSALQIAALVKEAGFPPGVFAVLSGFGPGAGQAIIEHPDILKVAFTGSGRTGRRIIEASSKSNLKKVSLELGGKSPAIVFEDADLPAAVKWTNDGVFRNMGQVCAAGTRIYVQKSIAEEYMKLFKEMTSKIKPSDQFNTDSTHGPQVDSIQFETIMKYIEIGKTEGKLVAGGNRVGDKGYFIEPTIFTDVPETARIMREEIFGPVAAINTFETEEEVIKRANDTSYGLYSAVFTKDVNRAIRVANAIQAGTVTVNSYGAGGGVQMPFGGFKESGQGRELGIYALDLWTQVKSVKINLA